MGEYTSFHEVVKRLVNKKKTAIVGILPLVEIASGDRPHSARKAACKNRTGGPASEARARPPMET